MLSLILPIWLKPLIFLSTVPFSMKFRPGESRAHVLSFCAILWLGTSGSIPWLDFVSLGKKVSGVLIFFPPPDRPAAWIKQRDSSLPHLSMHVACYCCLLPVEILFPFLSPHGEAHRSSHLLTVPGSGWLIVWVGGCVGDPSRVIIPVSVKHFFLTDSIWDWVSGS